MAICVIFNPAARGEKARRFRRHLEDVGQECVLKQTLSAGDARRLGAEAVREGFATVVAAGGDGTLNEVLNGIGDVPDGFQKARLGVLPLGTINVFAKEIGMPTRLEKCLDILRAEREIKIDLPSVEFVQNNLTARRYFIQLAGTGLDARAIELTSFSLKKKLGPMAYIWAGVIAMMEKPAQIKVTNGTESACGELALLGNGSFYGGKYLLFPRATLTDGMLDVSVFPKANWLTILRCAGMFFAGRPLPASAAKVFQGAVINMTSTTERLTPLEVDGENIGHLPAKFTVERNKLRVIVPAEFQAG